MVSVGAIFNKATTLIDGGWRVSFDLSEQNSQEISEIVSMKNENLFLVVFTEDEFNKQSLGKVE